MYVITVLSDTSNMMVPIPVFHSRHPICSSMENTVVFYYNAFSTIHRMSDQLKTEELEASELLTVCQQLLLAVFRYP